MTATTTRLVVRMTPEEKAALLQKARHAGLTVSEFVRRRINETAIAIEEERQDEVKTVLKAIDAGVPRMIRSLDNAIAMTEAFHDKINDHDIRLTRIESIFKS